MNDIEKNMNEAARLERASLSSKRYSKGQYGFFNVTVLDIETGPQDASTVLSLSKPFKPFEPLGEFDSSQVKTGNLKDPSKIAEKIEAARIAHEEAKESALSKWEADKAEYEESLIERAPLSAVTGCVEAVGFLFPDGRKVVLRGSEKAILRRFWHLVAYARKRGRLAGWNLLAFDLRFILRRCMILGVKAPVEWSARYLPKGWTDLMLEFAAGAYGSDSMFALDCIAKAMGHEGKASNGVEGKTFWKHFRGNPDDRAKAIEYLFSDLEATRFVAEKIIGLAPIEQAEQPENIENEW